MTNRRNARSAAPAELQLPFRRWLPFLPYVAFLLFVTAIIFALRWPREAAEEKAAGHRERDIIFLQSDFVNSTCGYETFNSIWNGVMSQLAAVEFRRARIRSDRGDTLNIDVYTVGNRVEPLQGLPQSTDAPDSRSIPPGDILRWRAQEQAWQIGTKSAHKKKIGRDDGRLYNLFEVVRTLLASPLNYLGNSDTTRLIFVGDMIHYDADQNVDADAGQSNLFVPYWRDRFAQDVSDGRLGSADLNTISDMPFSVYGISVPRCPSMPQISEEMERDYDRISRELWPVWTDLFLAMGATDVQFGLNSAVLIKD